MLSTIRDRNMAITIKATSASIPRIEEMNSNFRHPSALLMNHLNSLWAFRYWISLWYASSSPSVIMCSMTIKSAITDDGCWLITLSGRSGFTYQFKGVQSYSGFTSSPYLGPGPLYCPAVHLFLPVDNQRLFY